MLVKFKCGALTHYSFSEEIIHELPFFSLMFRSSFFSLLANGHKLMAWPGVVFVVVVVVVGVVNNFFPASSPQKLLHRFL